MAVDVRKHGWIIQVNSEPTFSIMPIVPILFVDASLAGVQIALIDAAPGEKSGRSRLLWHGAHSENMGALSAISRLTQEALAATSLTMDSLVGLAVASGPGSFTGIKIGMAFVFGLQAASARALPIYPVSTLEALALALANQSDVAVFLPATRTHGFAAVAPAPNSSLVPMRSMLVDCEQLAPQLLAQLPPSCQIIIVGDWPLLTAAAASAGHKAVSLTAAAASRMALDILADQVAAAWPDGFKVELPEPRYLRLSTAEERLQASVPQPNRKESPA